MRGKWDYQLHKHCRSLTAALSKYSTPMHIGGRPAALVEWKPARPGPPDERFPSIFRPTSWGVPKSHGELPVTMVVSMNDLLVIHGLDDLGGNPHDFGNLMKPLHLLVFEKSFPVRFGHIFTTICDLARGPRGPMGPQSIRVKEDVFGFPPNMVSSRIFVIHSST